MLAPKERSFTVPGNYHMNCCRKFFRCGIAGLALFLSGQLSHAAADMTTLAELKNLGTVKTAVARPLRIHGVVVCYDSGWHQLYLHDGRESLYFNADDFSVQPRIGQRVEISGLAYSSEAFSNMSLKVLGPGEMPKPKRLGLNELSREHGEWIETAGQVLSSDTSRGRLALLLHNGRQNCLVYLLGEPPPQDSRRWVGRQIRVRGINASKVNAQHLEPAMIFVPRREELELLREAPSQPSEIPVTSIGSLLNRELGPWTNQSVHVHGVVSSYEPGRSLVVRDPTGLIRAQIVQMTDTPRDQRVDVWGFFQADSQETFLDAAYFEVAPSPVSSASPVQRGHGAADSRVPKRLLTSISEISSLSRDEAALHLPVRLRGVVTFADPDWRNMFIQDRGAAVYVALGSQTVAPASGQWVELTGETSPGGFAPEVLSSQIQSLGVTNLPAPPRVDLEDLANGQLDAHWVEMEGVVRRLEKQSGHLVLSVMTSKGRFKIMIPGFENKTIPEGLVDAEVSVCGACTSELNSRRQLSGITLHAPGLDQLKVIDPPPADPFAIDATRIASVGTFDPHRYGGRRVKVAGVVTAKIAGPQFIVQDGSGGIRVLSSKGDLAQVGDRVEVLGFPAIGDFSPYLEEGVFRVSGQGALPEVKQLTAEQILLHGTNDEQLVELRARLLQDMPRAAHPQLVLQDGPIIFTAQLEPQGKMWDFPALRSGSLLKLTGVCAIQGGERHEPESFRLLIGQAEGIQLLQAPPWWNSRQAFTAAAGMAAAIVAALSWVWLLRRRVQAQTRMILEISTREQRRIGHDLHDGVCQQLAGIALMTSSLAEELEEQAAPHAAQAERISGMINEVVDHTRGIARGLFPIWLEENGLYSALEELATNAGELFKLTCRFTCMKAPPELSNTIALHLYYIALEAVANAAKHGGARNVEIRLDRQDDAFSLSIRDDGGGFSVQGAAGGGMGLRIMNYRAQVIGAFLRVQSEPGTGTCVTCLFKPSPPHSPAPNHVSARADPALKP